MLQGSADGKTYHELPFRYRQSEEHTAPRRAAPLAPRLDWRMGQASLKPYHEEPWLVRIAF